jgi:hypothetical protein
MRLHRSWIRSLALALSALALSAGVAWAQQQPPQGGHGGQPPTPPQEAFAACSGQSANATCTVNTPRGTISGTCAAFTDGRLFCRPEGMPPPPNR